MLPINGQPLLEHIVRWLHGYGVDDVFINLHHRPEAVVNCLGSGAHVGVNIAYSYEELLLGTAGAAHKLRAFLRDDRFIVAYGDVLTDMDLGAMLAFHEANVRKDLTAKVTMCLYRVANPTEVGLVGLDAQSRVTRFLEKPRADEVFTDVANAGILIVEPDVLDAIPANTPYDFGRDLFPRLLASGISIYGWLLPADSYLIDIGTPEKYERAQVEWPAHSPTRVVPNLS
jgi:NDP-sugar pyrophosphorylase family protein